MTDADGFAVPALPTRPAVTARQEEDAATGAEPRAEGAAETPAAPSPAPGLNYAEPPWSGVPRHPFAFEVVKGGAIVERVDLSRKPFFTVGRLPTCDMPMDHPSVSRFHAVVQHRPEAGAVYVYDLGSTHGTVMNKAPLKPRTFYRLRVGQMVRFGASTRLYVLQGPEDDEAEAAEAAAREAAHQRTTKEEASDDGGGIDWGFGEDAVGEDASVIASIRGKFVGEGIAGAPGGKEAYYEKDAKRVLRDWFDREGAGECSIEVEEKGPGHNREYHARIQLPVDDGEGGWVHATAVAGKKKDAERLAALEACRILDREGVLRAGGGSSSARKRRHSASSDSSGEDTFVDRTGDAERKRQRREERRAAEKTQRESKLPAAAAETHESLTAKLAGVLEQISLLEAKIAQQRAQISARETDAAKDELDAFMDGVRAKMAREAVSRDEDRLAELRGEEATLRRYLSLVEAPKALQNLASAKPPSQLPTAPPARAPSPTPKATATPAATFVAPVAAFVAPKSVPRPPAPSGPSAVPPSEDPRPTPAGHAVAIAGLAQRRVLGASVPQARAVTSADSAVETPSSAKVPAMLSDDPDYSTWQPPEGQRGDGRTSLNEKLGY
eukprot:Opistho-1_new@20750